VLPVVGALRSAGRSADYSYKHMAVGKQLKEAGRRNARWAIILHDANTFAIKDLRTGRQGADRTLPTPAELVASLPAAQ